MKILHTSDWHLGRSIYGRRCLGEFARFLDWLVQEIVRQEADCLLVAGDIFDTTTPSNSALSLYYSFLHKVSNTCCRLVVITGGNHDSPSLLEAPRQLLRHLNIAVIGNIGEDPADELITLCAADGKPQLLICAVPFLRDRDIRKSEAGESIDDKARNLVEGIGKHYRDVLKIAEKRRASLGQNIPIIAMGHLFTAGGKVSDNGELRDLYVGTLAHVHSSIFPDAIDYVALGHLHLSQRVDGRDDRRYCGAPLQLSFGDDNREKSITCITFTNEMKVETIAVPAFLQLATVSGDNREILAKLDTLAANPSPILVEIRASGNEIDTLREQVEERIANSGLELIRLVRGNPAEFSLQQNDHRETLEDLNELEVFRRCLDNYQVPEPERPELEHCFLEILQEIACEEDDEDMA